MSNKHDQKPKPIQVFWPSDVYGQGGSGSRGGLFYGWVCAGTHVVVVGWLGGVDRAEGERVLKAVCSQEAARWVDVRRLARDPPRVLGTASISSSQIVDLDLFHEPKERRLDYVYYRRPSLRQLRFFTLEPLQLDVSTEGQKSARHVDVLSSRYLELQALDFTRPAHRPPATLVDVIHKANSAFELDESVQALLVPPTPSLLPRPSFSLPSALRGLLSLLGATLFFLIRTLLNTCNARLPSLFVHKPLLKDVSATVQQVDTRLEQALFLPSQFHLITRPSPRNMAYSAAQYISFYNCIWLVLNDIIVGTAVGSFLCENAEYLSHHLLNYAQKYTVEAVRETLFWLDDWPVGLKLNTELSRFFCLTFVGLTGVWEDCLHQVTPYMPYVIYAIGCSGALGLTMTLSLLSDLLAILTLPLYFCYMAATAVFSNQLGAAYSLFNIFRGKRRNVLRNRIDSMEYDLDQVLLGTILFTLVTFLFPTVLAYYSFFATVRLGVIFLHATLETSLAFMNHFPLFVLMLRVKDPARLPGGIHFVIKHGQPASAPYLLMKNTPIPFSQIFFQHFLLWSRLSAHYHPLRLLKCLVLGIVISPIPRYSIRYSMIPERRDSFSAGQRPKVE